MYHCSILTLQIVGSNFVVCARFVSRKQGPFATTTPCVVSSPLAQSVPCESMTRFESQNISICCVSGVNLLSAFSALWALCIGDDTDTDAHTCFSLLTLFRHIVITVIIVIRSYASGTSSVIRPAILSHFPILTPSKCHALVKRHYQSLWRCCVLIYLVFFMAEKLNSFTTLQIFTLDLPPLFLRGLKYTYVWMTSMTLTHLGQIGSLHLFFSFTFPLDFYLSHQIDFTLD